MQRMTALLLLLLFQLTAMAQRECDLHIEVSVTEKHNGQPLFPVVAHIDELNRTYETNERGRFTMDSVCAGTYTFHFHAAGYEHHVEQVNIVSSGEVRFKLGHVYTNLEEVTVTTERNATLLQDKDKLNSEALARESGKSIGDMLQSINGVSVIANGATVAKPVIHGLHSNRIIMLNNGVRQEDQQWGGEHAPNIDPFLASDITVIKGASSVKYGADAIGGVVLVEPAPLRRQPGWDAELNMAAFSNNRMSVVSGMVGHNFNKLPPLSFRLQGTYKKGGNYRIPGYWVANTGVDEKNYSAALGWNKLHYGAEVFYSHFSTDLGIYTGSHTGNQNDLNAAINSDTPLVPADFTYELKRPRQHVEHDLVKTKMYLDSRIGMWHATYAYQHNYRQEFDVLRKESDKAQMNLTLNTQTLNLNLEHRPLWKLTGEVGVDGIVQENFIQPGDRLFIPNYRSRGLAGYLLERYKGEDWTLEGGVRYDYRWYELFNPEGTSGQVVRYVLDYKNISGTLGYVKQLGTRWKYSVILSNAWRAPQSNELFSAGLHHGAARVEYGNRDLKPERSYNINGELVGMIGSKLKLDISLYNQYIHNFIYLEPGTDLLTIRGYFKTFGYKQTDANLTGTDVSATYDWTSKLSTSFKGAFLFARNVSQKDWLILMPADRLSLNTIYTTDISEKLTKAFVSVQAKYVFSQWRIPQNFDQIDYPRPPGAYFLLDASIGTTIMLGKQPMELSLTTMNILNQRYRDYLDAFRYFIDQPGRNVVLRLRVPMNFDNNKKNLIDEIH
ncbi:MAG: TonB-dependent receptor [Chitinophagales bacterium]|nr:TonB-dependent receptor [Chitinophagaceae bacterium]MCB9064856.1 TonB-dependent receptor [Chitinophagales bacterium]